MPDKGALAMNEDDLEDDETEEEPECISDVLFSCPFCGKEVDYSGGCAHLVFSYELVNFEYLTLDKNFEKLALSVLKEKGYKITSLPCPVDDWPSDDDEGKIIPPLSTILPGLRIDSYSHSQPHGHDCWGVIVGFFNKSS
jgi:hypothetical protein